MAGRQLLERGLQKLYVGLVVVLERRCFGGKWARLSQIPRKWREEVGLLLGASVCGTIPLSTCSCGRGEIEALPDSFDIW